ncbi:spindle and kinetochore-associated protein 3 [Anguilla anguilla]|uniref:spindle and kinetochore-associated protein 3 n=1 Tax=Anguilla anguilla TaxID=7936 RepID=UPI0015B1E32E|nr:spindle and kinetochore-associated protein 3 [Anguilla anguilla]XP_035250406.1 spindle and kinetochore-associated protein 3 [Anguilla anguilla]XP_035250407.1 spindle and kinetochore-associated protein 3 [Anguilla anguilla]
MGSSSARFFGKLRNVAVFLETETEKLKQAHQDTAHDSTEGGVKVLYELHKEVRDLRTQVKDQLAQFEVEGREMGKCMQMLLVLKQRTTEDIQRLKKHYEKYGYKGPGSTQKHSELRGHELEAVATGVDEEEDEEKQGKCDEAEEHPPCDTPPRTCPPDSSDPMRTPRLSDFGLSKISIQKALSDLQKHLGDVPDVPRLERPYPTAASEPVLPKTPKCTLPMDEEALTPRLEDFGITEHTMCLNNDFTMDLLRKKPTKSCGTADGVANLGTCPREDFSKLTPALASVSNSLDTDENLDPPEPPVFLTPGFKLKAPGPLTTPLNKGADTQPPLRPTDSPSSMEFPVFESAYLRKLLSTVKPNPGDCSAASAAPEQKPRPPEHSSSNRDLVIGGSLKFDVPSMPAGPTQIDEHTPEMPTLESFLGNKFPFRAAGAHGEPEKETGGQSSLQDYCLPVLETHNLYTQDFKLTTPPSRKDYFTDFSTPEMPDISSETQNLCKLLSQRNAKPVTAICSSPKPAARPGPIATAAMASPAGKENRPQLLALVSESEFLSLPGYLRQMSLASLNQAIQKINGSLEDGHSRDNTDSPGFLVEDLKWITGVGAKTPVYFLCLTGLKRLEHVQGEGHTAVYRVLTSN